LAFAKSPVRESPAGDFDPPYLVLIPIAPHAYQDYRALVLTA